MRAVAVLQSFTINQIILFALVLARVSAVVMTAPIFGTLAAPMRVRALLAVALAMLVTPLYMPAQFYLTSGIAELGKQFANELLVGLLLGLGIMILFSGIQLTGQIVSQLSGTVITDAFDPFTQAQTPLVSQLLYFLTLAVFVLIGGHYMVMDALLHTFQWLPPGQAYVSDRASDVIVTITTQSFLLGIRAAAPVMASLLMATLVLGLIGRTLPQINILAVGFSINSMLALLSLLASVGTIAWIFQDATVPVLDLIRESFYAAPSP